MQNPIFFLFLENKSLPIALHPIPETCTLHHATLPTGRQAAPCTTLFEGIISSKTIDSE
jgi:hypothetical protein